MLLDRRHGPWAVATIAIGLATIALYMWLDRRTPGGLTGGTTVGLWYGIAGSLLMVYAGLLAAHRYLPRWWRFIGPRQTWLRGHIWLGTLSVVLIACHARVRLGGTLEQGLWIVLGVVIVTGFYGLLIQQFLPGWLARRFPNEAPYGQIPYLCKVFQENADELVDKYAPKQAHEVEHPTFADELRAFYEAHVRPFLSAPMPRGVVLMNELQSDALFDTLRNRLGLGGEDTPDPASVALDRIEDMCRDRRRVAEQERIHSLLHNWLLIHIPFSVALLILGVAHAITAVYF